MLKSCIDTTKKTRKISRSRLIKFIAGTIIQSSTVLQYDVVIFYEIRCISRINVLINSINIPRLYYLFNHLIITLLSFFIIFIGN